jgi:hypothetical protein
MTLAYIQEKWVCLSFFFEYGKYCSNSLYHNFANELIEEIYEDITDEIPLSFEKGLSGIGWGMFF